ncbi:hypothetical protein [Nitrosovibrio sp. Nv4]|uniref:hypothetical protein n=1 Tax=Nitrosovibrio sp. Nv4 TaxID=1945880 RepID=UPI000BC5B0E8|nr:hypothetical protein [Nitrosovibrio sp. Nv4]SOD42170.1 hypothetical protein SAMN06298226_2501 [Nitrosovibrio sp. Nv4]
MKVTCTPCAALIAFVMLTPQHVIAYEDSPLGQQEPAAHQAKQRGQKNVPPKPWESRPWASASEELKPKESRPWESASEELRPKELRPGERQATEERRRVGRKARKERLERKKENTENTKNTEELGGYQDRLKQRQGKWRRHQMESERYYPVGMR